jgi:hypothetical protein
MLGERDWTCFYFRWNLLWIVILYGVVWQCLFMADMNNSMMNNCIYGVVWECFGSTFLGRCFHFFSYAYHIVMNSISRCQVYVVPVNCYVKHRGCIGCAARESAMADVAACGSMFSTKLFATTNLSSLCAAFKSFVPQWLVYKPMPCSLGLSATSQQYFSLTTNQPPATS